MPQRRVAFAALRLCGLEPLERPPLTVLPRQYAAARLAHDQGSSCYIPDAWLDEDAAAQSAAGDEHQFCRAGACRALIGRRPRRPRHSPIRSTEPERAQIATGHCHDLAALILGTRDT